MGRTTVGNMEGTISGGGRSKYEFVADSGGGECMAYCIVWMSWSDVGRESRRRHLSVVSVKEGIAMPREVGKVVSTYSDEQYSMLGFGVTICLSQVVLVTS